MLPGLVNSLNAEELRDLVAYLKSGGDEKNPVFKAN
jgi:cytochrome c1